MPVIEHLTANVADYLIEHPMVSQHAIIATFFIGGLAVFWAPAWARLVCSDRSLRLFLGFGGRALGMLLSLTGLIYGYIAAGQGRFIASQPVMIFYYPASIMLSCAAIVFAGFQVYCALFVRPAPLMRAVVPALLGAWLFALAVPVYQFAVLLGLGQ